MKKIVAGISLLIIVITNSGCPKPCIEANYSFVIHSQITPEMDSINIGDTLHLISSFPSSLQDQNTSNQIDYSGAQAIGATLGVQRLMVDSTSKDAVFNFNYYSILGHVYNDRNIASPDGVQQLVYKEINGNYKLKIAIVPKVSGVYVFVLGNGLSTGRNNSSNCEKANFTLTFENTIPHFYLLYNFYPNAQFYGDGKSRVYYFKVK